MNIKLLSDELLKEEIPKNWYMLTDKGISDMRTCIRLIDGKWSVYFSERGGKFMIKTFDTESEACFELLSRMLQLKNRRR